MKTDQMPGTELASRTRSVIAAREAAIRVAARSCTMHTFASLDANPVHILRRRGRLTLCHTLIYEGGHRPFLQLEAVTCIPCLHEFTEATR